MSVAAHRISRRFGDAVALDDVSLEVAEGEFVALLGPSGSGKTTLLRVLAGLERADAGGLAILGRDVAAVPARERGIGVVFQHYALFRHMTVFENVAFGLRVKPRRERPTRAETASRVRELLRLVQVPELEARYPDQLSGGQRQRVALARALAIAPRLLLLDEPFGALDALVRREVRRWLRGLHDQLGLTTIMVTHDQEEAMELADRVAVMERGRIEQVAAPAALLAAPVTPFVAGFLGEATRVDGHVEHGLLHLPGLPPLRVALPDGLATAFLRPRDVTAVPDRHGEARTRLLRVSPDGEVRAVVEVAEGVVIDAVVAPGAPLPVRGAGCRVLLGAAQVFAADGSRTLAAPTAARVREAGV